VDQLTAERPPCLAHYLFGANETAYPRHLVTHHAPAQP